MIETIDEILNIYDVICDCCPYNEEFEVFSWDDLIARMKEAGWTIIYKSGDFEHRCPVCSHRA